MRSTALIVALTLASPALATVYTMSPVPCTGITYFASPGGTGPAPCTSISGTLQIEDSYVPGTFASQSADFNLTFRVTGGPRGTEFIGFTDDAERAFGSPGTLRMPVDSGTAAFNLQTPGDTYVLTRGLGITIGEAFIPSQGNVHAFEYTTVNNPTWTRVPEPGTLALLAVVLIGYRLASIKVRPRIK